MKKILFVTVIITLFIGTQTIKAQDNDRASRWEKFRAEKVSFLTDKLELTPVEAKKFWPVYDELERSRWEVQKTRRELEKKVREAEASLSKKDVIQLTRDYTSSMQKEGDLLVKYNEEFLKIIPPEKVLKLYQAENEFRMQMLNRLRNREPHRDN